MRLSPPKFWNQKESYLGYLLEPLSWLYKGASTVHRQFSKPYRASVPVISIGNFVLGGAGKTPLTIAIAKQLQAMGRVPHIISRGYGGSQREPVQVNRDHHSFHQVGDEPLLLAKIAPTWVSRNRRSALNLAIQSGADILLLDDGHQNVTVKKDFCFMVVNAAQGFGNGRVCPAGPLRQTIQSGLRETSALVYVSEENDPLPEQLSVINCPLIRANIVPIDPKPADVLAFSGIGYPEKFHQTLIAAGYCVKAFFPFPDHYPYTAEDMRQLCMKARALNISLLTTEKDALRIPAPFLADILTLPVTMSFQPPTALETLLGQFLKM